MEIQESMFFHDVLINSTSTSEGLDQLMHHAEAIVGAMQGMMVIEIETINILIYLFSFRQTNHLVVKCVLLHIMSLHLLLLL